MLDPARLPAGGDAATQADTPVAAAADARLARAAEDFEAMFIRELLSQMRRVTQEFAGDDSVFSNPLHGGMQDYADMQLADTLARQRAFGVADAILGQLAPELKKTPPAVAQSEHKDLAAFAMPLHPARRS